MNTHLLQRHREGRRPVTIQRQAKSGLLRRGRLAMTCPICHREGRRPVAIQPQAKTGLLRPVNRPRNDTWFCRQQQGFVLIVALVLLLVLTLLGLAAAQSTSLEERMAGNARNHDLAFQAAEAALGAGFNCVRTGSALCGTFTTATTGGGGDYIFNPLAAGGAIWNQTDFWTTSGNTIAYNTYTGQNLPQVAAQPQFIIEQMPPVASPGGSLGQPQYGSGAPSVSRWRITSYGVGGDTSSTVMLQAIYSCCQQSGG